MLCHADLLQTISCLVAQEEEETGGAGSKGKGTKKRKAEKGGRGEKKQRKQKASGTAALVDFGDDEDDEDDEDWQVGSFQQGWRSWGASCIVTPGTHGFRRSSRAAEVVWTSQPACC